MNQLHDLFTVEELRLLQAMPLICGDRHPTWYPLFKDQLSARDVLVHRSVALISKSSMGETWLRNLVPLLLNSSDVNVASTALSTIQTYGCLLQCGITVKANAIPDSLTLRLGEESDHISLQICSPNLQVFSDSVAKENNLLSYAVGEKKLGKFVTANKANKPSETSASVNKKFSSVQSLPNTLQADLIRSLSKAVAGTKTSGNNGPIVLALELNNILSSRAEGLSSSEFASPLVIKSTSIESGALWYALYGWLNAPIYECSSNEADRMTLEGQFRTHAGNKSRISAVLATLEDRIVLLENPWPLFRLPDVLRYRLLNYPGLELAKSVVDWNEGDANLQVALQRRMIHAIEKHLPARSVM